MLIQGSASLWIYSNNFLLTKYFAEGGCHFSQMHFAKDKSMLMMLINYICECEENWLRKHLFLLVSATSQRMVNYLNIFRNNKVIHNYHYQLYVFSIQMDTIYFEI